MRNLLIVMALILLISCNKRPPNNKIIHFTNNPALSSAEGKPIDSLSSYFPEKLFFDTTRYLIYNEDTIDFKSDVNVDTLIKDRGFEKAKVHVLDTTKIEDVSFFAKIWSFSLYKMKEPILYNYDLHKEIYRLIIGRSLSRFYIITIEKTNNTVSITTKRLNRQVGYPFMTYEVPSIIFHFPGSKKLSQKEIDRIHHKNDSLAKLYNNTNYYVDSLINTKITEQQWIELQKKLEKVKFWDSYPTTCGGCMQIDGSRWVIEGQNESGYQIHEVLDPFDCYGDKHEYSDLLKFIVSISGLKTDKFNFY